MPKYTFEINDELGHSFRVLVDMVSNWTITPWNQVGSWRTLDKGCLKVNSGKSYIVHSPGTFCGSHLVLGPSQGSGYGIRLNDNRDAWGIVDEGTGIVAQPWVMAFESGRISWVWTD